MRHAPVLFKTCKISHVSILALSSPYYLSFFDIVIYGHLMNKICWNLTTSNMILQFHHFIISLQRLLKASLYSTNLESVNFLCLTSITFISRLTIKTWPLKSSNNSSWNKQSNLRWVRGIVNNIYILTYISKCYLLGMSHSEKNGSYISNILQYIQFITDLYGRVKTYMNSQNIQITNIIFIC